MDQEKKQLMEERTHDRASGDLTQEVLATFDTSKSERFQQVMQSLVQSLVKPMHPCLKDVELTEEEWLKGIAYLTHVGHITGDKRQEFVLLSDVLGVAMQVIDSNRNKRTGATASTVFGPTRCEHHQPGEAPDGKQMDIPFSTMHSDFLLAPTETKEKHADDS